MYQKTFLMALMFIPLCLPMSLRSYYSLLLARGMNAFCKMLIATANAMHDCHIQPFIYEHKHVIMGTST